ncbi:MAG: glycosyltransferase [Acidobacteria bacterium]|nr:glycosyltransferase [Acidobacteriota bacterium]
MQKPEIALLLSTFERPRNLVRSLRSIACQREVCGKFELVVTDDGSRDETAEIVRRFAREVDFRVVFTTHEHDGFRLAQCRNEGVAASTAPYLLFLDGDCVLPPDHIAVHLDRARPGYAAAGNSLRIDREGSERITEEVVASGEFVAWVPASERRRLARFHRKAVFYGLIRHPTRPKLIGNNIGIWREDYERVNGLNEGFIGWGCEDDDLRLRLRRVGVRIFPIMKHTCGYHLWHPRVLSMPQRWGEGANVELLQRSGRLIRCRRGLRKRTLEDIAIRVLGASTHPQAANELFGGRRFTCRGRPEVEILFSPGEERFSGKADCNLLLILDDGPDAQRLAKRAHILVSDRGYPGVPGNLTFPLRRFDKALEAIA